MLRILVDESATELVVGLLRSLGHDVASVAEIALSAPDTDVLALAVEQSRVLITADKDFGDLVFQRRKPHASILLLRPVDQTPRTKVEIVAGVVREYSQWRPGGYIVATERSVRVRPRRR